MKRRAIRVEGALAIVPLTRGLEAILDAADAGLVVRGSWAALVTPHGHAYAQRSGSAGAPTVLMHRLILAAQPGQIVDHIDGDGLNNRRSNLRLCTHRQNMCNQVVSRRNRLGIKGVSLDRGRYKAKITTAERTIHLGSYDTPEEAKAAYMGAAKALFGEFARP